MATNSDDKDASKNNEVMLKLARERFDIASDAETELRKEALDDIKFSAGEQWPEDVKRARAQDARPCLTINRVPQFVRQITNDQRQNRPAIQVSPIDDQATKETAEILQGMIRHIEYASDAETAYDTAFDSTVRGGVGYFGIIVAYENEYSFDQVIKFRRIRNPMSVYLDPTYQQPDGSDANWGFIFETLSKDEFESQYPDAQASKMEDWASLGQSAMGWIEKDTVRVAEYFYKEFKEVTLVQLSDGSAIDEKHLDKIPEGVKSTGKKRKTQVPQIKWVKTNGIEVLDETDWLGRWIPIIPVLGEEIEVDGKRLLQGIVRHVKDSQRMYNYWASAETETIALAPRAPWIIATGTIDGYEAQWATANTKNHSYLPWTPKTISGQPAPAPTRNTFEPATQAITQARSLASEDMKATTGVYDAALGNKSNENSGIAIQRRNVQSQTSNFHFVDNLHKSLRHAGRILVDLIPKIYDTARATRIIKPDGQDEVVQINQLFEKNGKQMVYDLTIGEYDVVVDAGPSYQTRRQEGLQAMLDLIAKYPQMAQFAGDLMVRNMDWPGKDDVADRLKRMLPPQLQQDPKDGPPQVPPQAQQQMSQMQNMIGQLTQHLNDATNEIRTKKFELESRERIALAQMRTNAAIAMAKINSADGQFLMDHDVAQIDKRLGMIGFDQPIQDPTQSAEQPPQPSAAPGAPQAAAQSQNQMPTGGPSPGRTPPNGVNT